MTRPRIVHMHVPKTAGMALAAAITARLGGPARVHRQHDERKLADIDPAAYDFITGHFGYDAAARLGGQLITVFRDPVDRFVSVYDFWRQGFETGREVTPNTTLAARHSLAEFAKIRDHPPLIAEFFNRITWQLAGSAMLERRLAARLAGDTEEIVLRRAIAHLDDIAVIGLQHRMAAFIAAIEQRFALRLDLAHTNVTHRRTAAGELAAVTRRDIEGWTYLDGELYRHIQTRTRRDPIS